MLKDKEKYRELQLDAAEIMLGYFGFDRTVYRDLPKKNGKGGTSLGKDAERTLRVVCTICLLTIRRQYGLPLGSKNI